jgi:hypothetical protein
MADSPGLQSLIVKNNGNAGAQDCPDNPWHLGNVYFSDIQMNLFQVFFQVVHYGIGSCRQHMPLIFFWL